MGTLGRLLLRLLLVPLGIVLAIMICVLIVIVGQWDVFVAALQIQPDQHLNFFALVFLGPLVALAMAASAFLMLMPGAIGVVIAEAFAIRSFLFHVGNGVVSMAVGRMLMANSDDPLFFPAPILAVAAGVGAGMTYWLVAGWTAGLRPILRQTAPPAMPAAVAPTVPIHQTLPPAAKPEP